MSVAKQVVLGLLGERPSYPYELARRFERRIGSAWEVNDGHFYLAVADLEKQGLIEQSPNATGHDATRSRRRVMRLTERGHQELERWFADSVQETAGRIRSELTAKLLLADAAHAQAVLDNVEDYERARIEAATELVCSREPLRGALDWEAALVELLREAALSARIAEMHWLRVAREMLARLASQQHRANGHQHADGPRGEDESDGIELRRMLADLRTRHDEFLRL
jgi:DNA-binding PadR family transcriptional regulator